ncbi:MAG: ABC transporter permease [candidate division Zixibacteria bacterium]|nr:ABC transporter permease [candidate division Zixibacteria bacterium]
MTLHDLVTLSVGNMWRMKLRAVLTISGVVIAIAAFVSMLSFGAGNQKMVNDQFSKLGLMTTMQVSPRLATDSTEATVIDVEALRILGSLPSVRLAYPFNDFDLEVKHDDSQITTGAQALPVTAAQTRLFSRLVAGAMFEHDSSKGAVVTEELVDLLGLTEPDSIIGETLIVSVLVASLDSGLAHVFQDPDGIIRERLSDIRFDSLMRSDYGVRIVRRELGSAAGRFVDGFMNARDRVSDTLVVTGVIESHRGRRLRTKYVIFPIATATRFDAAGFSGDPTDLFSTVRDGSLFSGEDVASTKSFSRATLDLEPGMPHQPVIDTVEALGYRAFSFAVQFDEIQKAFFYFYLALGVVGFIALVTASLGIVNTMVMSITERIREIGILKALGADERDIKLLFLVESGVIGAIGAVVGIVFGWLITRAASLIARIIMERQGIDGMELFAMPVWLVGTAFLFGFLVSLAAGWYPAARAARVDPVEALRGN